MLTTPLLVLHSMGLVEVGATPLMQAIAVAVFSNSSLPAPVILIPLGKARVKSVGAFTLTMIFALATSVKRTRMERANAATVASSSCLFEISKPTRLIENYNWPRCG